MRKVELVYSEVVDSTNVLFIFQATFNKKQYGSFVTANIYNPATLDEQIQKVVEQLETFTTKDAKEAIATGTRE